MTTQNQKHHSTRIFTKVLAAAGMTSLLVATVGGTGGQVSGGCGGNLCNFRSYRSHLSDCSGLPGEPFGYPDAYVQ